MSLPLEPRPRNPCPAAEELIKRFEFPVKFDATRSVVFVFAKKVFGGVLELLDFRGGDNTNVLVFVDVNDSLGHENLLAASEEWLPKDREA